MRSRLTLVFFSLATACGTSSPPPSNAPPPAPVEVTPVASTAPSVSAPSEQPSTVASAAPPSSSTSDDEKPRGSMWGDAIEPGEPKDGRISSNTGNSPTLRQGATHVNGRLPPEVIQRIVRQNFGRFRLCYENGLRKDPTLSGRIAIKFVIDEKGAVEKAEDGGSDLPSKEVIACVSKAFTNLSFPQPDKGKVTVVYPIVYDPGSGPPPAAAAKKK